MIKINLKIKELRIKARDIEPLLRIGKLGLSSGILREAEILLKKNKLVKVRMLKSSFETAEKEKIINELVEKTNSTLVSSIGSVFTIYRESSDKNK